MNILVVDDHKIFLESISSLLREQIQNANVLNAFDGLQAIKMLDAEKPDLILLDINMPLMNGLEVAEHIAFNYPRIKLVILTNVDGQAMVLSLAKIVHGFLFKEVDGNELKKCIHTVMSGEKYFCENSRKTIFRNMNTMDNLPHLHLEKREIMLIELLAAGKTSKEMSKLLGVKEKTINSYREGLLRRTKTKNTTELVAFAFHNGLIYQH